jgi:hypothetical protein
MFRARGAKRPKGTTGRALLSPFDPLVWHRPRAERLFGFHYRIGIYTPAHLREHGYYDLPFLLGDRIAARVDLKADRQAGLLRVPTLHLEPGHASREVVPALLEELREVATWLDLEGITVEAPGAAGAALRKASA